MTDFSLAYRAEWHLYRVNADTWADDAEIGRLISASITRDCEGDAPELESGTINVERAAGDAWDTGVYRLAMLAIQDGIGRVDVATMICESASGTAERGRDAMGVRCSSVLHPAATTAVISGDFAVAGQDGAQKAAEMLRSCIQAPVEVSGSFALAEHYDFAPGSKVLECVWELLDAGGFCMQIDGRGIVHILPLPSEPALELDRMNAKLLGTSIVHSLDLADVPNRYTAVDGIASATASNDDADSPTSHATRGYWVDMRDESPVRMQGETLQAYAERMLETESTVLDERTYERRYAPDVLPFSIVRGSMPSVMLDGDMRVRNQSISCAHGIETNETAAKEIRTWSR